MSTPDPQTLAQLLAESALGDRAAFTRLYQLTSAKLYGVALRILSTEERAQECLQEAYINVWNHAGDYLPGRAQPMTWLTTIVRYRALDRLRRDKRPEVQWKNPGDFDRVAAEGDPDEDRRLILSEEAQALRDCLERLKESQRQSIELAFFEGLTHEEVAERTGSPLGSVKTWIRRGLLSVKECLEP